MHVTHCMFSAQSSWKHGRLSEMWRWDQSENKRAGTWSALALKFNSVSFMCRRKCDNTLKLTWGTDLSRSFNSCSKWLHILNFCCFFAISNFLKLTFAFYFSTLILLTALTLAIYQYQPTILHCNGQLPHLKLISEEIHWRTLAAQGIITRWEIWTLEQVVRISFTDSSLLNLQRALLRLTVNHICGHHRVGSWERHKLL